MIVNIIAEAYSRYLVSLEAIIIRAIRTGDSYAFAPDGSAVAIEVAIDGQSAMLVLRGAGLRDTAQGVSGTFSSMEVRDASDATVATFQLPGPVSLSHAVTAAFAAQFTQGVPLLVRIFDPPAFAIEEDVTVALAREFFELLLVQFTGFIQILTGSLGDDLINTYPVSDQISASDGDDTVRLSDGDDTIDGGAGHDTADGRTLEAPMIFGLADPFSGTSAAASFRFAAIETLVGTAYNDVIYLAPGGPIEAFGGEGNDYLYAGGAVVGVGLHGNEGNDTIEGDAGNDTLSGGEGANAFDGSGGVDTVRYDWAPGRVLVDFQTDVSGAGFARFFQFGAAQGDSFVAVENAVGGAFADNLRGDGAANVLDGGGVSDRLYGRAGDDTLDGGAGADALYGNLGADVMSGGDDMIRDRFIYFQANESGVGMGNRDVITDFTPGEDRIELSRIDADISQGFKQRFDFIGDAAFSGTGGELRYEQVGGNTIVQADRDGDGLADFEIELTGILTLSAGDFLI